MIQILVIEEKDCKVIMVNILSKVKGELEKIDIKMEDFHKQLNLLKMKIKKTIKKNESQMVTFRIKKCISFSVGLM